MKKLLITTIIAGLSLATFAKQHKISDMFNVKNGSNSNEVIYVLKVTDFNQEIDSTELTKFRTIASFNLDYMSKADNQAEFDQIISDWISMNKMFNGFTKKQLPLSFAKLIKEIAETKPVTAEKIDKCGEICHVQWFDFKKYANVLTANDIIDLINAGEMKDIGKYDTLNTILKDKGVTVVKKYLRKNGKTFVATRDENGNVTYNPLEAPIKELVDSLNAAKYEGFNAWCEKYNAGWTKITLPTLLDETKFAELKDAVLCDEASIKDNVVELRLQLGVDGFNAFIKEYNEGAK